MNGSSTREKRTREREREFLDRKIAEKRRIVRGRKVVSISFHPTRMPVDCGDIPTPTFGTNLSLTPTRREKKFDGEDVSTERIGRRKNRNV